MYRNLEYFDLQDLFIRKTEQALRQKFQVSNSVNFGISGNDLNVTVQLSFVF